MACLFFHDWQVMACLFFHDWQETDKFFTEAEKTSVLGGLRSTSVAIVIEQCSTCGYEQAYFKEVAGNMVRRPIDVDYAKQLRDSYS